MMLVWNIGTTWWICNSTVPGGIAAILANSFLMSLPWIGYYCVKKVFTQNLAYLSLLVFWLTFEYVHLNWQLSWPWLTLGNVFASHPGYVQWYEYTGTSGGSLWVLVVNILVVKLLKYYHVSKRISLQHLLVAICVLAAPLLVSLLIGSSLDLPAPGVKNVVVVQPDIDPYAKFDPGTQVAQLEKLIHLSEEKTDANTILVMWPETAVNSPNGIDETKVKDYASLSLIWTFLKAHPQLKLLTGIESCRFYNENDRTAGSRRVRNSNEYYDSFNAADLLDSSGALQIYHKSKFVPGVETLPTYLRFLDTWFEQFGGTSSGYVPQEERTVLHDSLNHLQIAPAICYESLYGEFITAYVRNGANIISIITNDGWWANTSGYKQHMQYARLRAIETRRWVLRSANTGISCFISPDGIVHDAQPWDSASSIKQNITLLDTLTFYVRYGDIISKLAVTGAVFMFLFSVFLLIRKRATRISDSKK